MFLRSLFGRVVSRRLSAPAGAVLGLLAVRAPAQVTYPAPYTVSTLAGGSSGSVDGTGTAAKFKAPAGVAIDAAGNVFVADTNNHVIRKVTAAGVVTTFAGTAGSPGSADGTGSAARFNFPRGIAADGSGNLFVADNNNHTIRKVTPDGVVTTLAGLAGAFGSADGTGSAARFRLPIGVAVDGSGNVYVGDYGNNTVRKITSDGTVTTLAGSATAPANSTDGPGSTARFHGPEGVATDQAGNVYVADFSNDSVRRIAPDGTVSTYAGLAGADGAVDGTGTAARLMNPIGLAVDQLGNVYVADFGNSLIRKIASGGAVTTLAGLTQTHGATDGVGSAALLNSPNGVAVGPTGTVYVADSNNNAIRAAVPPPPVASFTISLNPAPVGQPVGFDGSASSTPNPGDAIAGYTWDFGDGSPVVSSTSATATHAYAGTGNFTVTLTVTDLYGLTGSTTLGLQVNSSAQAITFAPLPDRVFGDAPFALSATASSGLAPSYAVLSGPATISGNTVTLTGAGAVVIRASQGGDANFAAAPNVDQGFTVQKGAAVVTLGSLTSVYDGAPKPAAVTTSPAGLAVDVTYNGAAGAPTGAGNYAVVATVNDPNYAGSASGTLVVARAVPVITWPAPAAITYGTVLGGAQLDATATTPGTFTYAPAAGVLLGAGPQVLGTSFVPADTADYTNASAQQSLTVNQATATVTLAGLSATYDGTAKTVSATTSPAGLAVALTYNGNSAAPSEVGSYTVSATVNDANYAGTATGTLVIAKITPTVTWAPPAAITYGTALDATQLNATASVAGTFAYSPGPGTVVNAGAQVLHVTFTPANTAHYDTVTAQCNLTVNQAAATVQLSPANATYDGQPHAAAATTTPAGLGVTFTYNGSASTPVNAGTYAVVATISDVNYAGGTNGSLVILPGTPVVTWPAPAAISFGTALSSAQLNATASVPGTFVYVPAAGTVPAAGLQVLAATFTPADTANYNAVTVQQNLVVITAPPPKWGADFNGDGHPDVIWSNVNTGDRAIWFLNGPAVGSFGYLAGIPVEWQIAGTADFDGDGRPDILWEDTVTGDRSIWLMNGTAIRDFAYLAWVDPSWHIAAVGDFDGDGHADLLWENAGSGGVDRAIWFLNGTTVDSFGYLAGIPPEWRMVGAADFDGDGHTDIVWEDVSTGQRSLWLMNGTAIKGFGDLGTVGTAWHIAMVADFNGDGQPDLLWENRTTGDRAIWLMNGTTHTSSVYLAYVDPVWRIAP